MNPYNFLIQSIDFKGFRMYLFIYESYVQGWVIASNKVLWKKILKTKPNRTQLVYPKIF